jgi:hypothetical protein
MSTEEGKMILNDHLNFDKKLAANQDLIITLEKALNHLKIDWLDWSTFNGEEANLVGQRMRRMENLNSDLET